MNVASVQHVLISAVQDRRQRKEGLDVLDDDARSISSREASDRVVTHDAMEIEFPDV